MQEARISQLVIQRFTVHRIHYSALVVKVSNIKIKVDRLFATISQEHVCEHHYGKIKKFTAKYLNLKVCYTQNTASEEILHLTTIKRQGGWKSLKVPIRRILRGFFRL